MVGGGIFGAWIGGLFFLLSYNGSQAVSWFGTNTLTLPSLLFGAVSVLFMLLYVKKNKNTYLWLSQISALASYYFKESGFIFIILLPFFYIMSQKKRKIFWPMVRLFLPIILFVIVILITTGIRMFAPTLQIDKPTGTLSGGMVMIVKNAIYYPILSFSQLFIPFSFLTKVNPLLREISSKTDLLFIFLSGVLIILIIFSSYMLKNQRRSLLFGLIFTLLSFIPFAVLDRGASYLSSRHFYTGVLGGSILIGIYVGISYNKLSAYSGIYRRTLLGIVLALFALYAYKNIQYIQRDTYKLVLDARERKTILNQIKKSYPVLPQNPVFYITGDHPGYYFVENQKMPFQQGIGYTLMMWYYPDSNDMNNLFPLGMKYLRNISDQGYIETNGKGFGYYFSKEALQSDLTKGKFFKKDIIGYYYHSASRVLEDISLAIQKEMP